MDQELEQFHVDTLNRLARAGHDKRSPFRTPMLATTDASGKPQARIVILRQVARDPLTIWIYTDARSPKVSQIDDNPHVELLFWDKGASLQVRLAGTASVVTRGAQIDALKDGLPDNVNGDYDRLQPPGSTAESPESALILEADHPLYFARLSVTAVSLDVLELSRDGHRRACFRTEGGEWRGRWVVP